MKKILKWLQTADGLLITLTLEYFVFSLVFIFRGEKGLILYFAGFAVGIFLGTYLSLLKSRKEFKEILEKLGFKIIKNEK